MRILRLFEEKERELLLKNAQSDTPMSLSLNSEDMYEWLNGCEVYWERYKFNLDMEHLLTYLLLTTSHMHIPSLHLNHAFSSIPYFLYSVFFLLSHKE